jgi:hypothetical protein
MLPQQNLHHHHAKLTKTLLGAVAAVSLLATLTPAAHAAAVTLTAPYGLAVDQNSGSLYVTDPASGQISTFDPNTRALTSFVTGVPNVFSVAVNSNGLIYAGIVGASSQINVYTPQAQQVTTFPVAPGDSPITMTFDADNTLYQASGFGASDRNNKINSYTNDTTNVYNRPLVSRSGSVTVYPYYQLQSYTIITPGVRYALVYDNGQIFVITDSASLFPNNIYDAPSLLSGRAGEIGTAVGPCRDQGCNDWRVNHWLHLKGSGFAAAMDSHHNIFYTDPDNSNIVVAGKSITPMILQGKLPSHPFGTAFDKTRSLLYVAFPEEHLVRAYKVTYTTQNGVQTPTLGAPGTIR